MRVGHSVVETGMGWAAAPPKEGLRIMNKDHFFDSSSEPKEAGDLFPMAEDVLVKIRSTVRSPKGGTNHDPSR
jgi:hypothetical protein